MQRQQNSDFDIQAATRVAVEAARAGNGVMRVHEAAHFIILEHGLSAQQQPAIIDALCHQCIRDGISIDFHATDIDRQFA